MQPSAGPLAIAASLVLGLSACVSENAESATAGRQGETHDWSVYLSAVERAERIKDPVQRCLDYPDLPGNQWPAGSAKARCPMLVLTQEPTLAEITAALDEFGGADKLDRQYAGYLEAHYNDPARREALHQAYNAFDSSAEARQAAEHWHADSPDSPYAEAALGLVLLVAASEARGSETYARTSEPKIKTMQRLLAQAKPMLQSALASAPRLSPACVALMRIGKLEEDMALRDAATEHCLDVDPLSWNVRFEWQRSLDPLWGGSLEAIERSVEQIKPLVKQNPALGSMLARGVGMRAYVPVTQGRPRRDHAAGFESAARIGPDPLFIGNVGLIAQEQNDLVKALAYLSQAIRLAPMNSQFLGARADVRKKMNDFEGAVADARRAIGIDPGASKVHSTLGQSLSKLGRIEEARAAFGTAMQSPHQRQWAFMRWCETFILFGLIPDQALACTQGLVQEYPDTAEALFMRSWVLYELDDPSAAETEARFRRVVDERDGRQRQMATQLEQLGLAKKK